MITIPITIKREDKEVMILCLDKSIVCHVDFGDMLRYLRELLRDIPQDAKITAELREIILQKMANEKGYVDWITLSVSLLFSMKYATNYAEFAKNATFYNKVPMFDYNADGYLDGLEIVRTDYSELIEKYRDVPSTLFIADPPYLSTDVKTYTAV